jgi:predicted nucleotidyltransferase component of viral defense system
VSKEHPINMAASVRQRLTNLAHQKHEDFQLVLTRYALERLLYRLSRSEHRDEFVLKGALLFQLWADQPHRPTRDLDLLGRGDDSITRFVKIFQKICNLPVEDDGLVFLAPSVQGERIKEDQEYEGLRLRMSCRLENARIPVQIDIGFGDVVVPAATDVTYPVLLDFPAPVLPAYSRESVVAEKFHAMVMLGIANSRMKDFYDLWVLARQFEFQGPLLAEAIRATFQRRRTAIPSGLPLALSPEFCQDPRKRVQWRAFLGKGKLDAGNADLSEIVEALRVFLLPVITAIAGKEPLSMVWPRGGPWREIAEK